MKRIVIKVPVECAKCRRKALKVAAVSQGVVQLSIEGEANDEIVVTGEGVDAVCLTNKMRKKFRYAILVSVEGVKDSDEDEQEDETSTDSDEDEQEDETNTEDSLQDENNYLQPCPICGSYHPPCHMYPHVVYDAYPNSCSIL